MKVEFTKEQFKNLMKLVYLGNWVANATRTEDRIEKYEKIENYIYSFAKDFGLEKYVESEEASKEKFYPTIFFEEGTDVNKLIEEYDNELFWAELSDRLGSRDFYNKYSEKELKKMTAEERFVKRENHVGFWEEEFYKNGIERIVVRNN